MLDRRSVRAALSRGTPIELVVEDGFDRAIGFRADLDGAFGGGFDPFGAIGAGEANDAETGSKALLGMGPRLQDLLAQRRRRRPDQARVLPDALDRPAGVTPMGGGHMLGNGRVLAVAAHPHMRGDPLALEENLDGPRGQPHVDLGAGEAIGHAVIVEAGVDVIINADAARAPFAIFVRLGRQGLERGTIDLLQQLPARRAEPADRPFLVEMRQQFADRRIDLGQTVKSPMAQPPQQPSLDDEHGLLDLRLVPRLSRSRRQNGGVVMRGQFGVGPVDLRVIEAGLDDGGLGVVRDEKLRNAADRVEGVDMGVDPIGQRLRPGRPRESEARGPEHGDEDLRHADFAGEPIDDNRHAIAGVIDKKPLARRMRLPHRHGELRFEGAIKLAEPRIAVTAWVLSDIFVPDDQQGDVLALQLAMDRRPIRLRQAAMPSSAAAIGVKRRLQFAVVQAFRQRPGEPRAVDALQRLPHRRGRKAKTPGDLPCRNKRRKLQSNNFARLAHRNSLRWHRSLPWIAKGAT